MLMANAVAPAPIASALWFPGKKMEVAPLSARALEIAKSREELLGLLRDLPDSELELSLTDLVEKEPPAAAAYPVVRKTAGVVAKERRKRSSSRGSFGSSGGGGDGVLLNLYLPAKLTRSLTTTRPGNRPSNGGAVEERSTREISLKTSAGCWSALWERGRGKSSRRRKLQM